MQSPGYASFIYKVEIPGKIEIPESKMQIHFELQDFRAAADEVGHQEGKMSRIYQGVDRKSACMDHEKIAYPLVVRSMVAGYLSHLSRNARLKKDQRLFY